MRCTIAFLSFVLLTLSAQAAEFPPITDAERALDAVPGQPGAPAVVLIKQAELKLREYPQEVSSYQNVYVRLKILSEEGKDYGEVKIHHSGHYRLKQIEGRTVLPDGRVVNLPKDAIFEERRSQSGKRFVTKLVFPAVEVGAIIDFRYNTRWDSLFFLEPWYFHNRVPTLLSEITFIKPGNLALQPWGVQAPGPTVQSEVRNAPKGKATRLWVENLPGIPDEPFGFSFNDLSSRFMMVPVAVRANGFRHPLLGSWQEACRLYSDSYRIARVKDRQARKHAAALAGGETSTVDKVSALHAFVRDEIQTRQTTGVGISEDDKVDKLLEERRGPPIGKALLLQSMLSGIKVDSDLIWVADRTDGRPDLKVANPWWFDAALVRVVIDNKPIYLDPVDRRVGFGHLAPHYEGTQGVVCRKSKSEIVELPATSFEHNRRQVTVDLKLDDEGRVQGHGTQELEGHQARRYLRWKDDPTDTNDAWLKLLEQRFSGYDVSDVNVEEDIRQQHVRVAWSMQQREEEVLGDETTILPSRPLVASQPFSLPPEQRRTPVQMPFGRRDDVITTIKWPAGWKLDVAPEDMSYEDLAGKIEWTVESPDGGDASAPGTLTIRRRFELAKRDFMGKKDYAILRELYGKAVKADAQGLVLVRD